MAIIKVINRAGKYKDDAALRDVIHYVTSNAIEGGVFGGAVLPEIAVESMEAVAKVYHKTKGVRLRHSVLSFSPDEDITLWQAKDIAQQAITYYQNDYQILAGVHNAHGHLHIHFVMNSTSYRDGFKYRGKKKDYYAFQTYLNGILRPYGIHVCLEK